MEQLIAHLVGDYVLQTDHMAERKSKSLLVAFGHAAVYSLPFLFILDVPILEFVAFPYFPFPYSPALLTIVVTHALIDHFRLARYVVWAKNQLAPKVYRYPFEKAAWHGYQANKPDWLAGWLYIIADNTIHLLVNYCAIRWL